MMGKVGYPETPDKKMKILENFWQLQGVHKKLCFSQFTATHPLHVEEQLILARDLSVRSLLLAGQFLYHQ